MSIFQHDRREADAAFAWHFRRYVADAGRQSLRDAAETETNPRVLLQFAEARFHSLIHGFRNSFFDSWDKIGGPFREAAFRGPKGCRAMIDGTTNCARFTTTPARTP